MVIASKLSRREFLVRAASCGPLIGEAGMAPGLPGRLPLALEDVLQAGKEQDAAGDHSERPQGPLLDLHTDRRR